MLGQRPGRFLLGLLLATAALALPLLILAMAYTAAPWITRVQVGPELSVFVTPGTASTEIEALRARLAASTGVVDVRLIPRDQAYAELVRRSGIAAAGERANPLPDVLVARFGWTWDPATIERAAATARQWPGVDAVQADLQWYRRLIAGGNAVAMPMLALAALTGALVFLALTAAAAAQVELRRDETDLLTLIGARPAFIVRPYAYAGALTLALACSTGARTRDDHTRDDRTRACRARTESRRAVPLARSSSLGSWPCHCRGDGVWRTRWRPHLAPPHPAPSTEVSVRSPSVRSQSWRFSDGIDRD